MKPQTAEHQLSENIIKKVALRFFRQYYKFRLRFDDQPVIAKYDLEGVGGVIADGYYSFKKTDGKPFIATFEATAKDSRDEVIYKPQFKVLFWDGLAFGSIFLLVLTSINYFYGLHALDERTLLVRLIMLLLAFGGPMAIYILVARNFRRYRYIYAVEQFKKYHADEQWIALADDVFANSSDKYYRELRNQCVYNGFGLMQIDQNLDTKILVTPSRQDIFLGKRQAVDFFPQNLPLQPETAKPGGTRPWNAIVPEFLKKDESIFRFRKSYNTQIAITLFSVILVGFIFIKEMQMKGYRSVDQAEFRSNIGISQSKGRPEDPGVMGDSALTMDIPNHELEELHKRIWTPAVKKVPELRPSPGSVAPVIVPSKRKIDTTNIVINQANGKSLAYDCSRFYNFESKKYIVKEGTYDSWPGAKRRLSMLRNGTIESAALLQACFYPTKSGFLIYLGMIYNSKEEASQYIEQLNELEQNVIKNVRQLEIMPLPPPVAR